MYSFFQSQGVGDALIRYATEEFGADNLWALEKNKRAISFVLRNVMSVWSFVMRRC